MLVPVLVPLGGVLDTLKSGPGVGRGGPRQAPKGGTLSHLSYWNLLHKMPSHTAPERFSGFFVFLAVFAQNLWTPPEPPRENSGPPLDTTDLLDSPAS